MVLLGLLLLWAVLRCSFSFFVVLPSFPSFLQVGLLCPLFCWVVLLCLFILWMVFLGGATFPLSSVGWCRLASFVGCCCVLHSPFAWCCLPSPPLGGAAFSPSAVWVLLCLLLLWAVLRFSSPSSWCCLPSPPSLSEAAFSLFSVWCCFISSPSSLGGATFSSSSVGRYCLTFSFFGWCFWVGLLFPSLLLGGAAWPPSLGGVALFPLSFCVVLPSFSPFRWDCFQKKNQKNRKNEVKNKK